MREVYEVVRNLQRENHEKEINTWADEALERYDLYGQGKDLLEWVKDYVYRYTCNKSLSESVAYKVKVDIRDERRGKQKQVDKEEIQKKIIDEVKKPVTKTLKELREETGLQSTKLEPSSRFRVHFRRGNTEFTGTKVFVARDPAAVKTRFLSNFKSKVEKIEKIEK